MKAINKKIFYSSHRMADEARRVFITIKDILCVLCDSAVKKKEYYE